MVPIALGVWGGGDRDLCSRYGGAREQEYLFAVNDATDLLVVCRSVDHG
jgi:hypothetical protein